MRLSLCVRQCVCYTVVMMSEWGDPEGEGEAEEKVEVGEEERATVSTVQQRLEDSVETFPPWPHAEVAKQLRTVQ